MSHTILAESNFLVPNATFIAEFIAFLIILAVIWRYVVPPVQRAMSERQEQIRGQIEESQQAKERLAAAEATYQSALTEARTEAAKIRDSARVEGQRIIDEMRATAQEEAERVRVRAEEQLATQRQQVVNELRAEIGQLATTLAERIVGESLTDDARRQRTVDRFLGELEEMSASTPPVGTDR
ncbi:MAG TPA: F0F1 ATP synthase subunit B [Mycobacteriales bacterium]|nr:F0F1 ATP synthase subunit B [Mycobacteriales bacterium]